MRMQKWERRKKKIKTDKNEKGNETLLRFMDKYNITRVILKKRKLKKRKNKKWQKKTVTKNTMKNVVTNPLEFELPNLSQGF